MAFVIAEPCIGTKDTACVDACPVDCIHPKKNTTYDDGRTARRRRPHFRHSLASGPLTDQLCTSRFGEQGISTPTCWGLLKQPDNQKPILSAKWHDLALEVRSWSLAERVF